MHKNGLGGWVQILIMAVVVMLAGCGDQETTVVLTSADGTGIVTGRIVEGATLQPVKNAEVVLLANGEKSTTQSSASDDPDLTGTFVFRGVSATAAYSYGHTLKISAPGFATTQKSVLISASTDTSPMTTSLGDIALGQGFDLTVIATDNGIPVPGITITASNSISAFGLTAITDSNGVAVVRGLNQESTYVITNAPFYAGNGVLQYAASSLGWQNYSWLNGRSVSLPLQRAAWNEDIAIIDSNLLGQSGNFYDPNLPDQEAITPDQTIKIVFNYSVTLAEPVTASFRNDLVDSSDPDFGKVVAVPTVAGFLDATGTILTITNSAPYLTNQSYVLSGMVTAEVNSRPQLFSLSSLVPDRIYVADTDATGLNPLATLHADNFNGTSDLTASTSPAQVYIEFPEKVYGTYLVVSTQTGTTTAMVNNGSRTFNFTAGDAVYAANYGGYDPAVVFRVPLDGIYLADNSAAEASTVTVMVAVTDAEGNNFNRTVTLPVQ